MTADRLVEVCRRADALVVTLPATDQTVGMVGADVQCALRPGAIVVNVGRGRVIDESALVDALRSGRLAGAALDVIATEPPPADSPLWELPNVVLSPDTAALSPRENERVVDLGQERPRSLRCATASLTGGGKWPRPEDPPRTRTPCTEDDRQPAFVT